MANLLWYQEGVGGVIEMSGSVFQRINEFHKIIFRYSDWKMRNVAELRWQSDKRYERDLTRALLSGFVRKQTW